jgi:hypothetical protein
VLSFPRPDAILRQAFFVATLIQVYSERSGAEDNRSNEIALKAAKSSLRSERQRGPRAAKLS